MDEKKIIKELNACIRQHHKDEFNWDLYHEVKLCCDLMKNYLSKKIKRVQVINRKMKTFV